MHRIAQTLPEHAATVCLGDPHARCRHHLLVGALALLVTAWSAITAAKVLARLSPALHDVRALVMYPCFLMYGAFALLTSY